MSGLNVEKNKEEDEEKSEAQEWLAAAVACRHSPRQISQGRQGSRVAIKKRTLTLVTLHNAQFKDSCP